MFPQYGYPPIFPMMPQQPTAQPDPLASLRAQVEFYEWWEKKNTKKGKKKEVEEKLKKEKDGTWVFKPKRKMPTFTLSQTIGIAAWLALPLGFGYLYILKLLLAYVGMK